MKRFIATIALAVVLLLAVPAEAGPRRQHCTPLSYGLPNSCHVAPVERTDRPFGYPPVW